MPLITRTCKVCGTKYKACSTPNPGIFRWRDIACCPEHAMEYAEEVERARKENRMTAEEAVEKLNDDLNDITVVED